jgi:mannose-6-phosphate isomerase
MTAASATFSWWRGRAGGVRAVGATSPFDDLPILKLVPLLKPAIWGGRRLAASLGRALPEGVDVGESWEVVDLSGDQSLVADGPLAGTTLGDLRVARAASLLGAASLLDGRFPLVLKFIDARTALSVQVHPGPDACRRLGSGARPKTEAWYVIAADPGSVLYAGLVPGVDRGAFEAAIAGGDVERTLHRREVRAGDVVFVPAGTAHAIGGGILLAEVQQSSDTTYRVFDWNRVGADGRPRPLHVEQALASIDFSRAGEPVFGPPRSSRPGVMCPEFTMELLAPEEVAAGCTLSSSGPVALMGVGGGGSAVVRAGDASRRIGLGETLLVPACRAGRVEVGQGTLAILAVTAGRSSH